jgi:hypothetical protein
MAFDRTYHTAFENDFMEIMVYSWKEDSEYFIVFARSKPGYPSLWLRHKGTSLTTATMIAGATYVAYLSGLGVPVEDYPELPTNTTPKDA